MVSTKRMLAIVLEFFTRISFVVLLYLISFSNHDRDNSFQVKHLRNLFLNLKYPNYDYSKVVTVDDYWNWLQKTFVKNIFAGDWYNGQPVNDSFGLLNDKANRLIGWATMRQLRVKIDTCRVKPVLRNVIPHCYDGYRTSIEDTQSFSPGWKTNSTAQNYSSSVNDAFIYQSGNKLDAYIYMGDHGTYGSGGYVYEFRDSMSNVSSDLEVLRELQWIDHQTRAVLIQLNLYNPTIPIFTSCVILLEVLPSSGVAFSARFEPLNMDAFASLSQLIFACIYLIYIVYFMIREVQSFIQLKKLYFFQFWSYIEIGIFSCSWACVGLYVWRSNEMTRLSHQFRQSHGVLYLNFQFLAYINEFYSFLIGFCCFFGTIKLLRLCRYHRRLSLLSSTLSRASRELLSFSFMFAIVFMAFLTLYYLEFVSSVWTCSSLLATAQMLFEMLLLKFDTSALITAAPILGPIYFSLFICFVVFVCINMFVSIVNDNFRRARDEVNKSEPDDHDELVYLLRKIQRLFGYKHEKKSKVTIDTHATVIHVAERTTASERLLKTLDKLACYVDQRYEHEHDN